MKSPLQRVEQLEAAFELLQGMVDQRLGEKAKVIEGSNKPVSDEVLTEARRQANERLD
jgi:hypothetical protein